MHFVTSSLSAVANNHNTTVLQTDRYQRSISNAHTHSLYRYEIIIIHIPRNSEWIILFWSNKILFIRGRKTYVLDKIKVARGRFFIGLFIVPRDGSELLYGMIYFMMIGAVNGKWRVRMVCEISLSQWRVRIQKTEGKTHINSSRNFTNNDLFNLLINFWQFYLISTPLSW